LVPVLLQWYLSVPYNELVVPIGTIIRDLSQAAPAQRIDAMIAILSALRLLATTWLRKRIAKSDNGFGKTPLRPLCAGNTICNFAEEALVLTIDFGLAGRSKKTLFW
jgi:hypothetical protein